MLLSAQESTNTDDTRKCNIHVGSICQEANGKLNVYTRMTTIWYCLKDVLQKPHF